MSSQHSPRGSRKRYARMVAMALVVGGLCAALIGCGGGASHRGMKSSEPMAPAGADYNALNAETYGAIVENEFRSPLVAPRSTFSADVNTASYSNVRRYIMQQNQLPPKDAVFLAELVNYFPYRYPAATGEHPASLTVDIAPCPWKAEHKLVRIGVRAKDIAANEMPPRNLVFLIDVSGSMHQANRLPLVKQALNLLVQRLNERDRVSIVTYASGVSVKLVPTPGSRKQTIRDAVNSLEANGSTNGEGGIQLAYEMARRSFLEGGANRVILCTDGDFNVGVTNEGDLKRLIEKERTSGVYLSVLGFGMGNLKNQTLETLANHGNGQYAYIDTLDEARKVFIEQIGTLVCVAKDVKFQVDFNPAKVNAYRLIGYENRLLKPEDYKDDAKDAGDMGAGHTVTALYEIVPVGVKIDLPSVDLHKYQKPAAASGNATEWLTVKMRYKPPTSDESKELAAVLKGAGTEPMSEDFRFAAAVAEFGLVLRDSKFKGNANLDAVIERASSAMRFDPNGHRREFIEMVQRAKECGKRE